MEKPQEDSGRCIMAISFCGLLLFDGSLNWKVGVELERVIGLLRECPVIAAVRHLRDLPRALGSHVGVVFFLTGTVFNIGDAVARTRQAGKLAFVHFDLLQGLSRDGYGMQYLAQQVGPDGIITTRANLVGEARTLGLIAVQRTFLLDSQSVNTGIELIKEARPDILEVLPGIIPSEVLEIVRRITIPLITGGLVKTKAQCHAALRAGAIGISTSQQDLWAWVGPKES